MKINSAMNKRSLAVESKKGQVMGGGFVSLQVRKVIRHTHTGHGTKERPDCKVGSAQPRDSLITSVIVNEHLQRYNVSASFFHFLLEQLLPVSPRSMTTSFTDLGGDAVHV